METDDSDFIMLATRAQQQGRTMTFIHDASTFANVEQPVDLHANVVAVGI